MATVKLLSIIVNYRYKLRRKSPQAEIFEGKGCIAK